MPPASGDFNPEPAAVNPQPAEVSLDSAVVNPQPAEVSPDSAAVNPQPAEVSSDSAAVNPQPAEVSSDSAAVNPQQAEVSPDSAAVYSQPAEVSPEPAAVNPQPAEVSPDLTAVSPQPAEVSPDSAAVNPQAAEVSPDSAAVNPQPAEVSSDSAAVNLQPAEVSSDLAAVNPQPAEVSPDSAAVNPQPAEVSPDLAAVYPQPAEVSPDLAAVYPVPVLFNLIPALYIGDLHSDVTEALLLEKFSSVGPVDSVRLCRARRPSKTNKYAFINFQRQHDAELALVLLNYETLLGQPMRIMWSNRNPSLRNSNMGNIFIKGLEKSIDSLVLYDMFSDFGYILSCKVVCDEHGSRGYGYVHFENAEAAEMAIQMLNGTLIKDVKVSVTHFKSRQMRQAAKRMTAKGDSKQVLVSQGLKKKKEHPKIQENDEEAQNPTVDETAVTDTVPAVVTPADTDALNPVPDAEPVPALYVGNLHLDVTESLVLEKFSSVGPVLSMHLCRARRPGTSNNYAFVNFQHQKDAERAIDLLNYDMLLDQPMRIMWSNKNPFLKNSKKGNIFIKGLEKSIDSPALYNIFLEFGNILSCKVVCDANGSKGYGYVHFESTEDAKRAINKLNGTLVNDHKLFITHFKSRQERQAAKKTAAKDQHSPPLQNKKR